MAYPEKLTSVLTGATRSQLRRWRKTGLVVPEVRAKRPPMYSYRDLLLIRSVVYLRANLSSQKIHKGFATIDAARFDENFDVEHASKYEFATDGRTIYLGAPDGTAFDLLRKVKVEGAQPIIFSFDVALESFPDFKGRTVPELRTPTDHVEVVPGRIGGWPTIKDTRVPYDTIARLVDYESVFPDDVPYFYPSVSADAAADAVRFEKRVQAVPA